MKRGSIYWVNLEPVLKAELGKTRPAIVVSNTDQNVYLPTVVVLPISSQAPPIWPLRMEFKMPNGKNSYAVVPGIRQAAKTRLVELIGSVSFHFLTQLDEAIQAYLSD